MVFKCLGSDSSGNCYLFCAENEILILEAGMPLLDVKKVLNWQLRNVVGCVVSHRHQDHAKYLDQIAANGIPILASDDVINISGKRYRAFTHLIQAHHGYKLGGFKIYAFDVNHDVPCLGFIIEHEEMGRTLFVTDTMMLTYKFSGLNHIMIECNYCDQILDDCILSGVTPPDMRNRLLETHMELATTKGVINANDLSNANEVILLHLSSRHSNENMFKREVEEVAGLPVYVAHSGMSITLNRPNEPV